MKTINTIAHEINAAAGQYQMGQFQEIRRQIQGLSRVKDHRIFTPQTIHEHWAAHSGGRTELQFNIAFESDDRQWFRYGVAFSLQQGQTLPNPLSLKPKIHKLNDFLRNNAAEFEDLNFWWYHGAERSPTLPIGPIPEKVIEVKSFLFWGKLCPRESADPHTVLFLFDRLLELYRYVEGGRDIGRVKTDLRKGFTFKPGCKEKSKKTVLHSRKQTRAMVLRQNQMQPVLFKALCAQFGEGNVGYENDTGRGSFIDLVVCDGKRYHYYEIKTFPCVRTCIRDAIGQLLEFLGCQLCFPLSRRAKIQTVHLSLSAAARGGNRVDRFPGLATVAAAVVD